MKKMIMMLLVTTVAFFANAAAIKWSMSGIQNLKDADGGTVITTSNMGTFNAYLVSSAFSETDLAAAIKDGTLAGNSAVMQSAGLTASRTGDIGIKWNTADSKDYSSANAPYSFYTVLLGNDYYLKTDTVTITATDFPDLGDVAVDFGAFTADTAGNPAWQPVGGGSGDVPEPTSGLLLLVGGALLALRRRQK